MKRFSIVLAFAMGLIAVAHAAPLPTPTQQTIQRMERNAVESCIGWHSLETVPPTIWPAFGLAVPSKSLLLLKHARSVGIDPSGSCEMSGEKAISIDPAFIESVTFTHLSDGHFGLLFRVTKSDGHEFVAAKIEKITIE